MSFLSIFRSQVPAIIERLQVVGVEIYKAQKKIEELEEIEKNIRDQNDSQTVYENLLKSALDSFGVALWLKDINGHFLYVNKVACETILMCSQEVALGLRNGDLKSDALAKVCMQSDKIVIDSLMTRRFIEHAVYEDGRQAFIDTIKSPVFNEEGILYGIMGNAVDISGSISEIIKKHHDKSSSIEIPLEATMSDQVLTELLERRAEVRTDVPTSRT